VAQIMKAQPLQAGAIERGIAAASQAPAALVLTDRVGEHELVGAGEVIAAREPVESGHHLVDHRRHRTRPDLGAFSRPSV
jgi:hypothetical protein